MITSYGECRVDDDPLICYGEVRVFMRLYDVDCGTAPAPSEECSHPPHPLVPPLLELCVDLLDTAPCPLSLLHLYVEGVDTVSWA